MRRPRKWLAGVTRQGRRIRRGRDQDLRRSLEAIRPLLFDEHQAWSRRAETAELAIRIDAMWDAFEAAGTTDPDLARRLLAARSWAVRRLSAAADLAGAIDAGMRALADSLRLLGADHRQTLLLRSNLGYAYRAAGRLAEAIPLYEQTLADATRVLGGRPPGDAAVAHQPRARLP